MGGDGTTRLRIVRTYQPHDAMTGEVYVVTADGSHWRPAHGPRLTGETRGTYEGDSIRVPCTSAGGGS